MTIDGDAVAERQARVERMIHEFREAQLRRFGKPKDKAVVESNPDPKAPLTGTPRSHLAGSGWPHEIVGVTVVNATRFSDIPRVPRLDDRTR